jgi:repressor LexA
MLPPPPPREPNGLTERQETILRYVQDFQVQNGYPPSIREIGEFFGIRSTNGVSDHLRALERKGFLQRSGHLSRSLTVVRGPDDVADVRPDVVSDDLRQPELRERVIQRDVDPELPSNVRRLRPERQFRPDAPDANLQSQMVPVLGKVAAGLPLLAVEEAEETLVVDRYLLGGGSGEVFALRVVGESMIDAGILPGDYLFVRRRDTAQSGEIAVVLLGGEATVKRWFPEGDVIRLQPENRTMQPIYVRRGDVSQCRVVGVVAGVYRRL